MSALLHYRATWDDETIELLASSHEQARIAAIELASWELDAMPELEMRAGAAWVPVEVRS